MDLGQKFGELKDKAVDFVKDMAKTVDKRCYFTARSNNVSVLDRIFGENDPKSVMYELRKVRRFLVPNTPTVMYSAVVEYDDLSFTQTNYKYPAYTKSYPSEITVSFELTAMTGQEAKFMLSVIKFLQTNSKSEFGVKAGMYAGHPPPVLNFNYLGQHMFHNVPVVIKGYQLSFEPDVDYVEVPFMKTRVPAFTTITITLETMYNPRELRDNFSLKDMKTGKLKGYI